MKLVSTLSCVMAEITLLTSCVFSHNSSVAVWDVRHPVPTANLKLSKATMTGENSKKETIFGSALDLKENIF